MDSRPILKDAKKIRVYIDSNTFNELLNQDDRLAIAILKHYNSDYLRFVRSPLETTYDELRNIVEYELIFGDNSEIKTIKITQKEHQEDITFGYKMKDIQSIAQKIYGKKRINEDKLKRIITVFIQAIFNKYDKFNIYITNDDILLKNRLWFESNHPGYALNIMSVEEASVFLDLFFKKNGEYHASSEHYLNKGYWYWLSVRLKIPHYNGGHNMIDALAYRLYYALMALDEIGIQHYLGVNNDTMNNALYHFNYLISLITGIFDNLALKTNTYLGINFLNFREVSLSNRSGKKFLGEVREKTPHIRDHIHSYVNFINLIYSFRERVIHREGLSKTSFGYQSKDAKWKANFIRISKQTKEDIKHCGDMDSKYDPFSKWGIYKIQTELFLDPYHFSIQAITTLIKFVDKYLELLNYPLFIETQKQKDNDFTRTLEVFEKYHLGF